MKCGGLLWQKGGMSLQIEQTQEIFISCARSLKCAGQSLEQNRLWFGDQYTETILGNNLQVKATISNSADPDEFKSYLKGQLFDLDHAHLNETIFTESQPTLENIAIWIKAKLKLSTCYNFIRIQVLDIPSKVMASVDFKSDEAQLTMTKVINCVHRHHNPNLTAEENLALYNKCSKIHGHEYQVEVTVKGSVDPVFGACYPYQSLESSLQNLIVDPYDKTFLNEHLGNTSGEIIAEHFYQVFTEKLPQFHRLTVRETRKNAFHLTL